MNLEQILAKAAEQQPPAMQISLDSCVQMGIITKLEWLEIVTRKKTVKQVIDAAYERELAATEVQKGEQ